jgi:sec-independent protein translocase protein TatC
MSFTGHLEELRSCLIKSAVAVMVAFLGCYAFAEALFSFLTAPILKVQPDLALIGTGVAEAFFTKLKVAFIGSLFVALPVILRQGWRFVAPGLYEHEKQYARYFVFFGTLFFLLGAWFCYEVVFQFGYRFFLEQYEAIDVRPTLRIGEYLSFSAKLLLAFGITFELPIAAFFLARVGVIDHHILIRQFRYAILIIFIVAAILTPPDVVSQVLLALPLTALYGVSIGVAYFAGRREKSRQSSGN